MKKVAYRDYNRQELKDMLKFAENELTKWQEDIKNNLATIERLKLENSKKYQGIKSNKIACADIRREITLRGVES